jgi:glycyl-tRNA synthetase beta chain
LQALKTGVENLFDEGEYELALTRLSVLRTPVDAFFDSVMVMTDDDALRNNRIALLKQMSQLFLHAADLSLLQQGPQESAA